MKDKVLLFAIGVLVGAIVSTGIFYVYSSNNCTNNTHEQMEMNGGPREMPSGQNNQNGEPPAKPDESSSQDSNQKSSS